MLRENVTDLMAFMVVARERSFTKAAAQLGISQSGLSHSIRGLEERLGLRLLTRTTRSVAPTPVGERILETITPRLLEVEQALISLTDTREKPAGTIRITAVDFAIDHVLWPKLRRVLQQYPEIKIELIVDYGLTDIVADRFDAGVRLGENVSPGMIAARISGDQRMVAVGSPRYFEKRREPVSPLDLTGHDCINLRLPTKGGLYAWEFEKDGRNLNVRVDGQMTSNGIYQIQQMALDGYGIAFVPEGLVLADLKDGRLKQVLGDYCPCYPGYHLYYPSRRQPSAAFSIVLEALRERT
ncbi:MULTISPECIES: LysR family transcriptional regulator [unclassified Rhizobium]|uniref:LysR family transcriptional regulator n=1 Tax=unclassified Rhizobium TaxID=2613769 RepID=UPI0010D9F6C3|nr:MULTISPECIES: LysR family transcriptional regulator [unclassified Rhizobium]MBP2463705.1 DNA-binding transcriptional LysR family regulator [Rhizobium sp. PvP014]MBP2532226.1 DNA-binding transcriptional LysR family regulator [Rhizobium sp. PvP099]RYG97634.1 MAG: LysR family transcriptional regulator [Alphaproteobacteria bacterium]